MSKDVVALIVAKAYDELNTRCLLQQYRGLVEYMRSNNQLMLPTAEMKCDECGLITIIGDLG